MTLKAPMPWFGGKSTIAPIVWQALGDPPNFVDPFMGSNALLLHRPGWHPGVSWLETVNDADAMLCNAFRAIKFAPGFVARWADEPVNENELHARHAWLVGKKPSLRALVEGDPDYYDAKIAGWWLWGMACWIGHGFCSGAGPWHVADGQLVEGTPQGKGTWRARPHMGAGQGVTRQLVHLGSGRGVSRRLVHLGNTGQGVKRQRVHLGDTGRGVSRQRVHLGGSQGVAGQRVHLGKTGQGCAGCGEQGLIAWMQAIAARFRRVRVCCGDWQRVCGPTPTIHQGLTGVFLDPPYSAEAGRGTVYTHDDLAVAHTVRAWCIEWGGHPLLRIVLCGYAGEHEDLAAHGWTCHPWTAHGGYGSQGNGAGRANRHREMLWLSPHCLPLDGNKQQAFDFTEESSPCPQP